MIEYTWADSLKKGGDVYELGNRRAGGLKTCANKIKGGKIERNKF